MNEKRKCLFRLDQTLLGKYLTIAVLFYLGIILIHRTYSLYTAGYLFTGGVFNLRLFAGDVSAGLVTAMSIMPINIPLLTTIVLIMGVLVMANHRVIIRDFNAVNL